MLLFCDMTKMRRKYVLVLCGVLLPCLLFSQSGEDTLSFRLQKAVEINAKFQQGYRTEADYSHFERDSLGAFEAIGLTADAVLAQAEGLYVRNYGGHGGVKTISVRGFATQQTQLTINGVPYRQGQSQVINFGNFPSDAFNEIQIYRSGGDISVNPLGGQVNFTINPQKSGVLMQVGVGSFGEETAGIQSVFVKNKTKLQVGLRYIEAADNYPFALNGESGIREFAHFQNLQYQLFFEQKLRPGMNLSYFATAYQADQEVPGPVLTGRPISQDGELDQNDLFHYLRWQYQRPWQEEKFPIQWEATLSHHYNQLNYTIGNQEQTYGLHDGMLSLKAEQVRLRHRFLATAQYEYAHLQGNNLAIDFSPVPQVNRGQMNMGLQHQWHIPIGDEGRRLATGSTLRFNHLQAYGLLPNASFQLNMRWKEGKETFLHLHYGHRIPSFNELYYFGYGNADLLPERVLSADIGHLLRFRLGIPFSIKFGTFLNQTKNKIISIPINPARWSTLSIGRAQAFGAEVAIEGKWKENLNGFFHYTLQQAQDLTRMERPYLPYTPTELINYGVGFSRHNWNVKVQGNYSSWRFALLQNGRGSYLPPYQVLNVSLGYLLKWHKLHALFYGEIENLTDEKYVVIQSYPMPPRSVRLGLRLKY